MSSAVDLHTSTIFDLRGLAANGAKVYIGGRRKEVLERVADEWTTHGKGTIIPYVKSSIQWLSNLSQIFVTLAFPSMSQVGRVLSRPKISLKKRKRNYTFW
jgi:hypothetical protein